LHFRPRLQAVAVFARLACGEKERKRSTMEEGEWKSMRAEWGVGKDGRI
jgi:hypothetical protein